MCDVPHWMRAQHQWAVEFLDRAFARWPNRCWSIRRQKHTKSIETQRAKNERRKTKAKPKNCCANMEAHMQFVWGSLLFRLHEIYNLQLRRSGAINWSARNDSFLLCWGTGRAVWLTCWLCVILTQCRHAAEQPERRNRNDTNFFFFVRFARRKRKNKIEAMNLIDSYQCVSCEWFINCINTRLFIIYDCCYCLFVCEYLCRYLSCHRPSSHRLSVFTFVYELFANCARV